MFRIYKKWASRDDKFENTGEVKKEALFIYILLFRTPFIPFVKLW